MSTSFDKLPPPLIRMLAALEDDPAFGPKTVAALRGALRLLDRAADSNFDALCALQALAFVADQPGTAREKFERTADLAAREAMSPGGPSRCCSQSS